MTRLTRNLLATALLALAACPIHSRGQDEESEKPRVEAVSPDGRFAFRFTPVTDERTGKYDLIDKRTGKVIKRIAESDADPGPSSRFGMQVLWRPDSKAFAVTETFWKRSSLVAVYRNAGAGFREIEIPKLEASFPKKLTDGKEFSHIVELNGETAKLWQKDGSLIVEISLIQGGADGTISATRTVTLGFPRSAESKVLSSHTTVSLEKD